MQVIQHLVGRSSDEKCLKRGFEFAGKYVPTLAKKIHDENEAGNNFRINLAGLGIGNGITAPEHSTVYADYLYQVWKSK